MGIQQTLSLEEESKSHFRSPAIDIAMGLPDQSLAVNPPLSSLSSDRDRPVKENRRTIKLSAISQERRLEAQEIRFLYRIACSCPE